MLKASVRGFVLAACMCGLPALLNAGATRAQTAPNQSLVLLPLNTAQIETSVQTVQLAAIAQTMNNQIACQRSHSEQPTGLTLADLPLIGDIVNDVVDENGNFDGGMNLPVSVGVGKFMDAYGVTLSVDWSL